MPDHDNPDRQDSTFDSPPYRPPGARMEAERPLLLPHAGMGVASFVIALVAGIGTLAVFGYAGYVAMSTPGGVNEQSPVAMLIGLGIIACAGLLLLGLLLGIAALFQSGRRKSLAVVGLILNGLAILATLGVMALGVSAQ